MKSTYRDYNLIACDLVRALGGMLDAGKDLASVRVAPALIVDICRQARKWDHALHVDMPAGDFTYLAELADYSSIPASIRRHATSQAILHARRLIGQGQFERAEQLVREAQKLSPDHYGIGSFLGPVFYSSGHTRQALEWFEREPNWRTCRTSHTLSHCMLLMELHEYGQARLLLDLLSDMESSPEPLHRLQFYLLTDLLSTDALPHSVVVTAQEPLAPIALQPYSTFLMRRAESPDVDLFDQRAVKILASTMLEEHRTNPYPAHQLTGLAHWLILAGRSGEGLQLIKERELCGQSIMGALSILCVFLWIKGEVSLSRKHLPRVDFAGTNSDMGWFIHSVACSVTGNTDHAAACLSSLFRQAPGFFMAQPGVTVWGMFALVLKALGHDPLARAARALATREDPWDSYRAHLWDRVTAPASPHPFPPFPLPAIFTENKS